MDVEDHEKKRSSMGIKNYDYNSLSGTAIAEPGYGCNPIGRRIRINDLNRYFEWICKFKMHIKMGSAQFYVHSRKKLNL